MTWQFTPVNLNPINMSKVSVRFPAEMDRGKHRHYCVHVSMLFMLSGLPDITETETNSGIRVWAMSRQEN